MWMEHACRIALFGHRDFNGHRILDERLYPLLRDLLQTEAYLEIYIGRNGEFDRYAASVIKRLQRVVGPGYITLLCILPYRERCLDDYAGYYDGVIIPEELATIHPRRAITGRNRWMVEQADLVIAYTERCEGGAYAALQYAKRLKKETLMLAEQDIL